MHCGRSGYCSRNRRQSGAGPRHRRRPRRTAAEAARRGWRYHRHSWRCIARGDAVLAAAPRRARGRSSGTARRPASSLSRSAAPSGQLSLRPPPVELFLPVSEALYCHHREWFEGSGRMARKELAVDTVAEAYLALLAERGIEYLFANAGTDFAPLVEAFSKAARTGAPVPQPVLATHENLALSMAHGYAMVSRRVPAVMVHVSVGTANGVCGAFNAARENVPMLFTAGRSPLTESGLPGARDVYIHWAQEMFDQAGMLREIVKWEYELRNGRQLETVIDRALSVATTQPGGPVYLSLPREVLAEPLPGLSFDSPTRRGAASPPGVDKTAIDEAARIFAAADNPLIVSASAGRDPAAVLALADFAQRFAIPVVQHRPRHLCLPAA